MFFIYCWEDKNVCYGWIVGIMGGCALVVLLFILLGNMGWVQMGKEGMYLGMFLRVSYQGENLKMSSKIIFELLEEC